MIKKMDDLNNRIILASEDKFPGRKTVLGEGQKNSSVMLIGEAPGGEEESRGRPFVGKAGKNLDAFLDMTGLDRKNLYITNVVKIRPCKLNAKTGNVINRSPSVEELEFFIPFLMEEIDNISPSLIVTLGNTPLRAVMGDKTVSIGEYHGKEISVGNKKVFPLYHPAAVIYNTGLKQVYIDDLRQLRSIL